MWLRMSAVKGNVDAMIYLGIIHATGIAGVKAKVIEARAWCDVAAAISGNVQAQRCLARITGRMSKEQVEEAADLAKTFRRDCYFQSKSVVRLKS